MKQNELLAGGAGERVGTNPGPVKGITGAVLGLIVLFTHSVNLDTVFLPADKGCTGTHRLLFLNNANATGEQNRHRQAKNHVFHSGYIPGHSQGYTITI